jgi:uncharacterized repeat protein (TIGR03803 family)
MTSQSPWVSRDKLIRALAVAAVFALAAELTSCSGVNQIAGYSNQFMPAFRRQSNVRGRYEVVYRFKGVSDGATPIGSGLVDVKGTLYGSTSGGGGSGCGGSGCGTVFSLDKSGAERVIYRFKGGADGAGPRGTLLEANGLLYGTTRYGGGSGCGGSGCGTVFRVNASGDEHVLHAFGAGDDGQQPYVGLVNVKGTLYGTTLFGGGTCDCGTVYSVRTSGAEKVLHRFASGTDGSVPSAGLIAVDGTLYGTTQGGGNGGGSECAASLHGCGTVFRITTSAHERVIYSMKGGTDGVYPTAVLFDVDGELYGVTGNGGGYGCGGLGCGAVFKVTTSGSEHVVYRFRGIPDGANPYSNFVEVNGVLLTTTNGGGLSGKGSGCSISQPGCGTIVELDASGHERVFYRFKGSPDGAYPQTYLSDADGVIYGTTLYGGDKDKGIIFQFTP